MHQTKFWWIWAFSREVLDVFSIIWIILDTHWKYRIHCTIRFEFHKSVFFSCKIKWIKNYIKYNISLHQMYLNSVTIFFLSAARLIIFQVMRYEILGLLTWFISTFGVFRESCFGIRSEHFALSKWTHLKIWMYVT